MLVVVTAIVPAGLVDTLQRLRGRNRRTTLISLAEAPPPFIPGVETFHAGHGEWFSH